MKYLAILTSITLLVIISCAPYSSHLIKFGGYAQGTTYNISYTEDDSLVLDQQIDSLLRDFDLSLSTYNKKSLITKVNNTLDPVQTDTHLSFIVDRSYALNKSTKGAFDITVGTILQAYGFGKQKKMLVDSATIDSLMQYVGMDKITFSNNSIQREKEGVYLDVNAIAQGYSVDLVGQFLEDKGITNYLVEIGGEILAKGTKNGKHWRVGIDKPIENNFVPGASLQAIVELQDKALATSGNYRKFYEKDGQKIVHTIDPKTGYSKIHNLLSATIIASDCTTADAYATACMVLGLEGAIKLIESDTSLQAYFIYGDKKGNFQVYQSSGLEQYITELE